MAKGAKTGGRKKGSKNVRLWPPTQIKGPVGKLRDTRFIFPTQSLSDRTQARFPATRDCKDIADTKHREPVVG